jgi:LuxR family maltose regulon positive regulatory protein
MKQSNEEILKLMEGQNSYIALQESAFTFGSPHYLYLYFRDVGSFRKIADILSEEVGYAKFSNGCGTGCDSLSLAEYALETGDFEQVELHCEQARVKADIKAQTSVVICSTFTLLRYRLLEGRITEALDILKRLEEDISSRNDSMLNTSLDLCKGYIYANLGQLEKIPLWLQTGDMDIAYLVYEGIAFNYLVYGKAVMLAKRYAELEVLITQFDTYFAQYSNQLGFIHNGIFKAVAKFHLYGSDAGITALEAVLKEAFEDHIVMPFIEAAPYITEMLQIFIGYTPDNEFINRIYKDCLIYKDNIYKLNYNPIPLSQREIEIITLIDQGLSRKQISEQLYISQETAKTHLKNIYLKLEVGDKVSALRVAKARGFLNT